MTINTKFDIGDKIWYLDKAGEKIVVCKCPVCNGTGSNLLVKNIKCNLRFDDDLCKYKCVDGFIYRLSTKFVPYNATVYRITASKFEEDGNVTIEYGISDDWIYFENLKESDLFATKEEAQAECDKRNESNKRS